MATYTTYDQIGQAEDVSGVISNIAPTDTPFQTSIGKGSASARLYEWQEDDLAAVGTMDMVEGADFVDATLTPTVMRQNYTQIMSKAIKISKTSDAVKTHGRAKETALQTAKKGAEWKRDFEHHLVGIVQNARLGDAASVSRLFGNVFGTDVAANAIIDASVTDGNAAILRAFDEAAVLAVQQAMFAAGSNGKILMIKPADSLILAGFAHTSAAGATLRGRDFASARTVVNVVNVYVSPFGEVKAVLNRFLKVTEALIYDPAMWKTAVLRPISRTLLAKTGDADRHAMVGECGLKHMNYKATGRITDLS